MRQIKNKRVLVAGGAGFIGSHLVDKLILEGASDIKVVDNMFLGSESNLLDAIRHGTQLIKEDIEIRSSVENILKNNNIDIVFNCATKPLNYSFINPQDSYLTNVNGILNFLECQRLGLFETLCHFSSSEVYGTAVYEPMDEKHPKNPTTLYAAGKAAADLALESYVRMFNLDSIIVRPFNNFGPRQNSSKTLGGIIPVTVLKILTNKRPEIHGSGFQKRDFIHVEDTVDAALSVFYKLEKGESVNISSNNMIEITDLISKIAAYFAYNGEFKRLESRRADVLCHNSCNKKLKSLIEFKPKDFDTRLHETLEWYKSNLALND